MKRILIFLSVTFFAHANDCPLQILVPHLKGIVLLNDKTSPLPGPQIQGIEGVAEIGLQVPGDLNSLKSRLAPFFYQPVDTQTIYRLKNAISKYYSDENFPIVQITVPEQDFCENVIQLVLTEGTLGEIFVEGNCWTPTETVKNCIHLQSGARLNQGAILKGLNFINRNPLREAVAVYSPGKEEGSTDLTILTRELRPYRFYSGIDNTGIKSTETFRWFAGFNNANLFVSGHIFSFQYTTSSDFKKFQGYTAQYTIPLPNLHVIDLYGGYSKVDPDLPFPSTKNKGHSGQASLRYYIPFRSYADFNDQFFWGADYKRLNNTVEFSETFERIGKNINLTELVFGYEGYLQRKTFRMNYTIDTYISPGGWLPNMTNSDYNSLRPHAKNQWIYARGVLNYLQSIPKDFTLVCLLRLQGSAQNLLPSEQAGIGGYDTVRGFLERTLTKDNAALFSFEVRTPSLHPLRKTYKDDLLFLWFLDSGGGFDRNTFGGMASWQYLLSTGIGARYNISYYLKSRIDWGIHLHPAHEFQSKIHYSLIASF